MTPSLANKVAVITGGSSGIGRAVAVTLAAEGAHLFLIGRHLDTLRTLGEGVRSSTQRLVTFQADLTVDADIERLKLEVERQFGAVDLLVHSAGILALGSIEAAPATEFDAQYRCNVRAPLVLTQALLPMIKKCHGQIVFMNSTAGLEARANVGQYAATKHALRAIADSLRAEVNPAGVRVLSLFLGRTATPMQEAVFRREGKAYSPEQLLQPEDIANLVMATVRLPRTVEVTEIRVRPAVKSY